MSVQELKIILGLLVAVAAIVAVSRRTPIPYPILLVAGGLALAMIPGLPAVHLQPDLMFLVFLPPLLYRASLTAPFRDFRANRLSIYSLAFGLILVSAAAVGLAAHLLIPGLPWPAAFVMGAVLAPTDEVAITEVSNRLPVPDSVLTILQGESLINDASSLVIYRFAIAATASGMFSVTHASLVFVEVGLGGTAAGLLVAWSITWLRRRLPEDPPVENTISLLTPFAAYLAAEALGVSGVLAVVAAGLYLNRQGSRLTTARTRLQAQGFWQMVIFMLNGLLFILTGLQLRTITSDNLARLNVSVICDIAAILAVIVAVRFICVFLFVYVQHAVFSNLRARSPMPPWQNTLLVAMGGIRGGISLVAALAIPFTLASGHPFPDRSLLICISFYVILATLLLQGLSLPLLIHRLRIPKEARLQQEEIMARLAAARAALSYLDGFSESSARQPAEGESNLTERHATTATPAMVAGLRDYYERRAQRLASRLPSQKDEGDAAILEAYHVLLSELIQVRREAVITLRDKDVIDDDVMRRIEQDLDLEEVRLGPLSQD